MQSLLLVAADFETALAESVNTPDTTATLNSDLDVDGVALTNGTYGFTVDNNSPQKEYIVATLTGTALTSVFSISRQGVATTGFGNFHRKGATVEITDWAALSRVVNVLNGTTQLDGGTPLSYDSAPALGSSNQLATVQYVLDHVNGGAVSFNATVMAGLAGETITIGQWVYLKETDGRWYKTDATDTTKCLGVKVGKALGAGTAGNSIASGVFIEGLETTGTYAPSTTYYLSNTPGALATSAGTNSVAVGVSDANSKLIVSEVSKSHLNALAGGGSFGTPATSNKFLTEQYVTNVLHKFGGTGTDGALSITSGTTTIDLAGAALLTKNYTSISITGTGALAFSNPNANGTIIILKSQGNVTLTSVATPMLSGVGLGATGATGAAINTTGTAPTGTSGLSLIGQTTGGGGGAATTAGAGGIAGAGISPTYPTTFIYREVIVSTGAGGGAGASGGTSGTVNSGAGGNGGRGGGAFVIECAGAFNFTTASGISVAGVTGTAGTGSTGSRPSGGGAGGGAGGSVLVIYNTLTANSGTVVLTGSVGTACGVGTGAGHGGCGAGGGNVTAGSAGPGGSASDDGAIGGTGATGWSLVTPNTVFF